MAGNANSGRRPQPAKQAILKGNPSRVKSLVTETPFPDGSPQMPDTLGPAGVEAWKFIVKQCDAVPGMLKLIDAYSLGIFCHAVQDIHEIRTEMRENSQHAGQVSVSSRKALREAETTAIKIGGRYGWTPSDRVGKVFGSKGGPIDPLQALLQARNN